MARAVVRMRTAFSGFIIFLAAVIIVQCEETAGPGQYDSSSLAAGSSAIERGKQNMNDLMARTKLPKYGTCWLEALQDLKVACKLLDAKLQSRLAFAFASCFVEMLGFPPYLCAQNTPIEECARSLDQRGYDTFMEYFLHTQDMCFYLSSQVWQQETDKTVNQLVYVAAGVTQNMDETKKAQEEILRSQQEALKVQTTIMTDNNALYSAVVRVKQLFDDFVVTADDHQKIFKEIFDKITKVQNLVGWIQGEMSVFDMFGFYFLALIFGVIATSTKRTINARFWLVILFTTTFFLERFLTNIWMSTGVDVQLEPEQLQQRVWWFRRFATLIGGCIVLVTGFMYQDYHIQNNHSLKDMQAKMDKQTNLIKKLTDLVEGKAPKSLCNGSAQVAKPVAGNNGGSFSDDDFETDDETFSTDSDSSAYSKDSESSSDSSASIEVEMAEKIKLIDEGKKMFPDLDKENNPLSRRILNSRDDDIPNGPPIQTSTPKFVSPDEGTPRYNLRARNNTSSVNPLLKEETSKAFARKVNECRRKSEQLAITLFKQK